ncbi:MAG TPA: glycosyltransferase [Pyrinomonadaceae bacterium]|nr:glycosyltransferase [Pyrinomonadaceae bacterium]
MPTTDQPLVSILIPAYNCRPWIRRAVESALNQTWKNCEVIALDDCSTDGTDDELKQFADSIHLERSDVRHGQNAARNRLTDLSSGKWLVYLDADDELDAESVELKLQFMAEADAIYGSTKIATYIDGPDDDAREVRSEERVAEDYVDLWAAAFAWKFPNTTAFCFKRRAVIAAGGWNEKIKNCTDYDLYFRLLLNNCRFKAAPRAWSTYRQWSATQAVNENPLRKMMTRLQLMFDVVARMKVAGEMTPPRRSAFFDASLGVLRTIYPMNPSLAIEYHDKLLAECPECRPSKDLFPTRYRLIYQTIGFSSAERIAGLMRS